MSAIRPANRLSVIPVYSSCCSARLILRRTRRSLSDLCWRGRGICSDVPINQSRKILFWNYVSFL